MQGATREGERGRQEARAHETTPAHAAGLALGDRGVIWLQRLFGARDPVEEDDDARQDVEDIAALMEMASKAAARGDWSTALGVWRPLAEQGWPRAQANLGSCYAESLGVPYDLDKAARWFTAAAKGGDVVGTRHLADLYFRGEGVAQDDERAAALFELAAEQGDAQSQDMLSWMLLEGEGVEQDLEAARLWAVAAAEQGVATSMTRLGLFAHDALGMRRDAEEAARWWYEAARRGEADGQALLGGALHFGQGVQQDDRAALIWLLRARAGGSALAETFVDEVRAALTPEQEASAVAASRRPLPGAEDA